VNIRHLGRVRRLVDEKVQVVIMVEMLARVIRKQLQEKFRKKTRYLSKRRVTAFDYKCGLILISNLVLAITRFAGIPTEEPHKVAVVKYFNKLLGRQSSSTHFWKLLKTALLNKFDVRSVTEDHRTHQTFYPFS